MLRKYFAGGYVREGGLSQGEWKKKKKSRVEIFPIWITSPAATVVEYSYIFFRGGMACNVWLINKIAFLPF